MGGGSGGGTTTTSTNSSYPEQFRPLAESAVSQIQAMQGLLPLTSFTNWMPGGTAGLGPAAQFGIDQLLPSTLEMGEGTRGLLSLAAPVGQTAMGALGASGPTGAENLAMSRLLHTGGTGEGLGSRRPDLSALGSMLPPSFSPETAFPGLTRAAIRDAQPGISRGEVPNVGGWGPSMTSTTSPSGPGAPPFPTAQPPNVTDPGMFRSMLPPSAQGQYTQLVAGGMAPAQAFSQALSGYIGTTTQAAQPPMAPPGLPSGGDSPGGF